MSIEPGTSTLLLIGSLTLTVALLYRIQVLMDDSTAENREQVDRLRAFHRQATQKYVEALKQLDVENEPPLSADLLDIEDRVPIHAPEYEEILQ